MANRILQNFELAVHNRTRLTPDQFGGSVEILDSPAELGHDATSSSCACRPYKPIAMSFRATNRCSPETGFVL